MTREEFLEALSKALDVEATTDLYVRAGMLKLDEPKSASEVAKHYLTGRCRLPPSHGGDCILMSSGEAGQFIELLDRAGLQIVEK